jgi:thiol:disulfide interchange protein DsbC
MILFPFLCILLVIFTPGKNLATAQQCEEDFEVYQNFTRNEIQEVLKKINRPEARILSIQMSIVYGLYEVVIENKGQYELFYLDFSKTYLIPGPIIDLTTGINKSVEKLTELEKKRRIDLSKIPLGDALILGNKKATNKVIVFTDPDCPFCRKLHTEIKKVVEKRKDLAFYIKLLPLQIHSDAYWKSKSIICNKSLKYLEDNFEKKPIPKPGSDCQTREVDENIKLAKELGINGTPTTIFPDGSVHAGFLEAGRLIEMVDLSIAKKK